MRQVTNNHIREDLIMSGLNYVVTETKFDNEKTDDILMKIGEILPHGSGIDSDWNLMMASKTRVRCQNAYHCMDEFGGYDGWADFVFLFDLKDGDYCRLMFIGQDSHRLERKYQNREYLEQLLMETLYHNFEGADITTLF